MNSLIDTGIKCEFINFNSREFEVIIKNKSFQFFKDYYQEIDEKLLESQDYEIDIVNSYLEKFSKGKLQNKKHQKELQKCSHFDNCKHMTFDLIGIDEEPTEEEKNNLKIDDHILKLFYKKQNINKDDKEINEKLNDELKIKINSLSKDTTNLKEYFTFKIPFDVKIYITDIFFYKLKSLKNIHFNEKTFEKIKIQIKFKKIKVCDLFSKLYYEVSKYLNLFFKINRSYDSFLEHLFIIKAFYISIYLDLKEKFYEIFLKKEKLIYDDLKFSLLLYLLNEIRQFRWSFTQIFEQLLEYGVCKSKLFIFMSNLKFFSNLISKFLGRVILIQIHLILNLWKIIYQNQKMR